MFRRDVFGRIDASQFSTLDRRALLRAVAGAGLLAGTAGLPAASAWAQPVFRFFPFSLGVASGEPAPDGFVIWTKLAPEPLAPNGGLPMRPIEVAWEVAEDPAFRIMAARGRAMARPELGHAVHVEVAGLRPARDYFYRFQAGAERSRVGRAKTLPAPGTTPAEFRFAVAGCQRYEDGHFTAFRAIAEENLDAVFHYGDYIYEYRVLRPGARPLPVVRVMPGDPDEIYTVADYRHRYALYKLDPDLQAAHASAPFLMSFDDHEVDNNWAGGVSEEEGVPAEVFALRRIAGFQAWYEHMPLRASAFPRGASIDAHRRFDVGDLARIDVLDTRQYRSDQPCGDGTRAGCAAAHEASRTMLGAAQERWLSEGFRSARPRWNVLAQQVVVMSRDLDPTPERQTFNMDKWDGASAARDRLVASLREAGVANTVILTGDVHNAWAGEVKVRHDDAATPTVAVEHVATSITSGGDGSETLPATAGILRDNPHIRFFDNRRGYTRHVVTREAWRADYRVVDRVTTPDGRVSTHRSFVTEAGRPGLVEGSSGIRPD
jgi:alkaline phosphatase D